MTNNVVHGRIQSKRDTCENWDNAIGFIPLNGEIIIYTDYQTVDGKRVPAIKVGDGGTPVQDLPFIGEYERDILLLHIQNANIHITPDERASWNHKITCDDTVSGEKLILTRN